MKSKQYHNSIKSLYGINKLEYNVLLASQDNSCAICNTHVSQLNRGLFVDHDHSTGQVRGLLCHNCNTGIGMLKDDPKLLQNALWYFEQAAAIQKSKEAR